MLLHRKSYQKTLSGLVKYDEFYQPGQWILPTRTFWAQFSASFFSILPPPAERPKKPKCKQNCQKVYNKSKTSFLFFSFFLHNVLQFIGITEELNSHTSSSTAQYLNNYLSFNYFQD